MFLEINRPEVSERDCKCKLNISRKLVYCFHWQTATIFFSITEPNAFENGRKVNNSMKKEKKRQDENTTTTITHLKTTIMTFRGVCH